MQVPVDWLLDGAPYVRYATRRYLLGESPVEAASDREATLLDPQIQRLLHDLSDWPGDVISSHKSAGQPFHKLTFLADVGLRAGDAGLDDIIAQICALQSPEGPFALKMKIGQAYGGTGEELLGWALCDAPLLLYALLKFGLEGDARVQQAGNALIALGRWDADHHLTGWPCAVSATLGSWRGPGRKDDPCPFATLAMLKAVAQVPAWRDTPAARAGAETILDLWADSLTRHPYIFYMGTDFRKLKAPFIWYDLLHVLDVLTCFPWIHGDPRLSDMLAVLERKADEKGRFTPESVWQAWGAWEFGQKKMPSRWLTLLAHRILRRVSIGEICHATVG